MTSPDKLIPDSSRNHDRDVGLRVRLDSAVERALEDRRIVGTVVMVAKGGDIVYRRAAGFADREAGRSMQEHCIFLLASVAKPFVTAAALRLVENGRIGLGDSVRRWLPEFKPRLAGGRVPEITIHHLLTHSAGLTYVFLEATDGPYHRLGISSGLDRTDANLDEIVERISAAPLSYEPGAGWGYSMAIDVLGAVIEKATLQPLPHAVAELVLNPLDIKDTAFSPARLLDPRAFPSGGSDMAGTASDVLRFLETLRAGGLLQPQTRSAMFKVQAVTRGQAEGPGWEFGFGGAFLLIPTRRARRRRRERCNGMGPTAQVVHRPRE